MRLGPDEVALWSIDLSTACASPGVLSVAERDRAARFRDRRLGARWAVARTSLRAILASYVAAAPASLVFDTTCGRCGHPGHGKPTLIGHDWLCFSASRSGVAGLVAVAHERSVGVDLEQISGDVDWPLVAARAFTAEERATLVAAGESGQCERATALWCRKEAVAKALGAGLALDPRGIHTEPPRADGWMRGQLRRPAVLDATPGPDPAGTIHVHDFSLRGARAALAVVAAQPPAVISHAMMGALDVGPGHPTPLGGDRLPHWTN